MFAPLIYAVTIFDFGLGGLANIFIFAPIIFNTPLPTFGVENPGPVVKFPQLNGGRLCGEDRVGVI